MKLPQYISSDEVKRVCRMLKLRDWCSIKSDKVTAKEAKIILSRVNTEKMAIPLEAFRRGLEVELEHGTRFKDANVTNNHPLITGMIVLAHLKEMMDYYERLEVAELEGDIFKAVKAGNFEKVKKYFKRLVKAKIELSALESLNMK
jgi:pentatricopeptide repeat protein